MQVHDKILEMIPPVPESGLMLTVVAFTPTIQARLRLKIGRTVIQRIHVDQRMPLNGALKEGPFRLQSIG